MSVFIKRSQQTILWSNVIIAILCIPGYIYLDTWFRLIIAPFIIFMIWSKRSIYLPGLIIHNFSESTISYIILSTCFLLTIYHYKLWLGYKLRLIFFLAIIPLPILLWQCIYRYYELSIGFSLSFVPIMFYFGLFPFFYGILIAERISKSTWTAIYLVLGFALLLDMSNIFVSTIRIIFFSLPALITILIVPRFGGGTRIKNSLKIFGVLVLLFYSIVYGSTTFTILGTIGYSILLVLIRKLKFNKVTYLLTSKWALAISILAVIIIINNEGKYSFSGIKSQQINPKVDWKISSFADFKQRIASKTFEDRAPIWLGAWKSVMRKENILPPIKKSTFKVSYTSGHIVDINFGAHNIYLEILRNYGLVLGTIICLAYIFILIKTGKILTLRQVNPYLISTTSTIIAIGIIGGMTGVYPLLSSFSLLMFGLAGICHEKFMQQWNENLEKLPEKIIQPSSK
jgi:hypothetical protein